MCLRSGLCLLVTFWSVLELYRSFFPTLLRSIFVYCALGIKILTQMCDVGSEGFELGYVLIPGSVLLVSSLAFAFGLRVLECRGLKWFIQRVRDGFCLNRVCNDGFKVSRSSCKADGDHCSEETFYDYDNDEDGDDEFHGAKEEFEEVGHEEREDEVLDVITLRKMVKAERRKANAALSDLEKERMSTASAAEEAMAMIFRLQNEKSSLQTEVNQLQRWAEEIHIYDQEVIQSLHCALMRFEEEKIRFEEELKLCKKRLKVYEKDGGSETYDCINGSSPWTPSLSQSQLVGCKLDDLRIGSLDSSFRECES